MKHVTFADKSVLTGDAAADALLEYSAALAGTGNAATVDIAAISSDGDEVVATYVLAAGSPIMAETTHSSLPEPDNDDITEHMKTETIRLTARPNALAGDDTPDIGATDYELG